MKSDLTLFDIDTPNIETDLKIVAESVEDAIAMYREEYPTAHINSVTTLHSKVSVK